MSRSQKKGPFIDYKLFAKVLKQKETNDKSAIQTWARRSEIAPEFVGHRFNVHNGKKFEEVFVSEGMVGHKLGEFVPTRTFRGHGKVTKRVETKT